VTTSNRYLVTECRQCHRFRICGKWEEVDSDARVHLQRNSWQIRWEYAVCPDCAAANVPVRGREAAMGGNEAQTPMIPRPSLRGANA